MSCRDLQGGVRSYIEHTGTHPTIVAHFSLFPSLSLLRMVWPVRLILIGCGYWVVIGVVGVVWFFGPDAKNPLLRWTYRLLCDVPFRLARTLVTRVCGRRGWNALGEVKEYVMERPNPVFQLFYLFLVIFGFLVFHEYGLSLVPNPYVPFYHVWLAWAVVLIALLLFLICSYTDPGIVNPQNVACYARRYDYDYVLYIPKVCRTCGIDRPARSKHCRLCNVCVARLDHHCVWFNNCMGARNYRYFILFLLHHCLLLLYGGYLGAAIVLGDVERRGLWRAYLMGTTRGMVETPVTWTFVLQWCVAHHNYMVGLSAFCALLGLVLLAFTLYHIHLVLRNTTTNETFKWSDIREIRTRITMNAPVSLPEEYSDVGCTTAARTTKRNSRINRPHATFTPRERAEQKQAETILSPKGMTNLYDVGWWGNVVDLIHSW